MTREELSRIYNYSEEVMLKTLDIQHDFSHVERVRKNALEIVEILNLGDNIDSNLLQSMCLLHDMTYANYSPGLMTWAREESLVKKVLSSRLKELDVDERDSFIILEAVSKHSHSFPLRRLNKKEGLYVKVLQDTDTLDFFHQKG